jgi:hypothetical protein
MDLMVLYLLMDKFHYSTVEPSEHVLVVGVVVNGVNTCVHDGSFGFCWRYVFDYR